MCEGKGREITCHLWHKAVKSGVLPEGGVPLSGVQAAAQNRIVQLAALAD